MRLLARLHAAGANNPSIIARHREFKSWFDFFHATKSFGLDQGARAGPAAAGELIPARTHVRQSEVWGKTEAAVARSHARPKTVMRGDVHLKNWYVAGSGEMGLSDWQCTSIGHWGRDVAYTLSTSLTIENRRAWERDLLALYLDELGQLGGPVCSFDEAWTIYREEMLPALAWWTVTFMPPPGAPDMQPKPTAIEFVRRIGTAVDDLGSLDV
jgi:Phosphotransferase enzyme family